MHSHECGVCTQAAWPVHCPFPFKPSALLLAPLYLQALAGLWGQLMVYGTVPGVNPCGNVNLQNYFSQQ